MRWGFDFAYDQYARTLLSQQQELEGFEEITNPKGTVFNPEANEEVEMGESKLTLEKYIAPLLCVNVHFYTGTSIAEFRNEIRRARLDKRDHAPYTVQNSQKGLSWLKSH